MLAATLNNIHGAFCTFVPSQSGFFFFCCQVTRYLRRLRWRCRRELDLCRGRWRVCLFTGVISHGCNSLRVHHGSCRWTLASGGRLGGVGSRWNGVESLSSCNGRLSRLEQFELFLFCRGPSIVTRRRRFRWRRGDLRDRWSRRLKSRKSVFQSFLSMDDPHRCLWDSASLNNLHTCLGLFI